MSYIKCPTCGKWFKSLGYARHRTMHYDRARAKEKEEQLKQQQK